MLHHLTINVDHFQFYVEDPTASPDYLNLADRLMSPLHVATSDGLVAVATARWGGETTVEVEVLDHPPAIDLHAWDRIVECSIDVPSGRLRVYSVEEDLDAAPTIDLAPGNYLILVQSADLDTVPDDTGTEGDDHYRLTLWPGSPVEPRMIK